jgi:hypothetical protein
MLIANDGGIDDLFGDGGNDSAVADDDLLHSIRSDTEVLQGASNEPA